MASRKKPVKAKKQDLRDLVKSDVSTNEAEAQKAKLDEAAITSWLLGPARTLDVRSIVEGFGRLCFVRGLPFHRIGLFTFYNHPQLHGSRYHWSIKNQIAEEFNTPYDVENLANPPKAYAESPMYKIFNGQTAFIYRPLYDKKCPLDFPILKDFKSEGLKDYLAFSLYQSGSQEGLDYNHASGMVMTLGSYEETGFGDENLRLLQRLIPVLAMVLELVSEKMISRTILETYVGKRSGQLVLDGRIHKGDGETIPAVIWFCDMREFTKLTNKESQQQLVNSLNDFFECMVGSVDEAGGEVLKFMGDALLAIFPLPKDRKHFASTICEMALAAAEDAKDKIAALNKKRAKKKLTPLKFGVSLHIGDVNYGNIGGGARLDFTVLGKAVNLASRLQGLNAELKRVILVSNAFRKLSKRNFEFMGQFPLKGITKEQKIFALKR